MLCSSKYTDKNYTDIHLNLVTLDDGCSIDIVNNESHFGIDLSPNDAVDLANRILNWYK